MNAEIVLTTRMQNHLLTNANVWSADSRWLVYDTRTAADGSTFDGTTIEAINIDSREVRRVYTSENGACCGVATWNPAKPEIAFILGPEHPTAQYSYGPSRRRGVLVDFDIPGVIRNLDARNLTPPFTAGALRGGSHVHLSNGHCYSFTYDDDVFSSAQFQRTVAVAVPQPVSVPRTHPRNHDGEYTSVVVASTVETPRDGSDEIGRAYEEAWLGNRNALAFLGDVNVNGVPTPELFVVELPVDLTCPGDGPLPGTITTRPAPPHGTVQRRLTFGGLARTPRHWVRSNATGTRIGFLKNDDSGTVQFHTIHPDGGEPKQVTNGGQSVASAFTWHPDGIRVACVLGTQVCLIDTDTGRVQPLTPECSGGTAPRPEACAVSPDGMWVAYLRRWPDDIGVSLNQIRIAEVPRA